MFMIVAVGANNIEIPCRFSKEKSKLEEALVKAFPECKIENDKMSVCSIDEDHEGYGKLFTSYYGGCGSPYAFEIRPVVCDSAVLKWDLD